VLGLDHPEEFVGWNIDSDDDPRTPVSIDCKDPARGLGQSDEFDTDSVTNSVIYARDHWENGLSVDDVAGRDFLYPVCRASP
jgi:hypothetical protein